MSHRLLVGDNAWVAWKIGGRRPTFFEITILRQLPTDHLYDLMWCTDESTSMGVKLLQGHELVNQPGHPNQWPIDSRHTNAMPLWGIYASQRPQQPAQEKDDEPSSTNTTAPAPATVGRKRRGSPPRAASPSDALVPAPAPAPARAPPAPAVEFTPDVLAAIQAVVERQLARPNPQMLHSMQAQALHFFVVYNRGYIPRKSQLKLKVRREYNVSQLAFKYIES